MWDLWFEGGGLGQCCVFWWIVMWDLWFKCGG